MVSSPWGMNPMQLMALGDWRRGRGGRRETETETGRDREGT